jgi:hypothetical protein
MLILMLAMIASNPAPIHDANLTQDQVSQLQMIQTRVGVSDQMRAVAPRPEEVETFLNDWKANELKIASGIVGRTMTSREDVEKVIKSNAGWLDRVGNFLSFMNILKFVMILAVLLSILWVFHAWFFFLIISIPVFAYELLAYVVAGGFILFGPSVWFAFFGCGLFLAVVIFTISWHVEPRHGDPAFSIGKLDVSYETVVTLLCTLVWGSTAYYWHNQLIGFFAVGAVEAFLGFAMIVFPFCVVLGFKNDAAMIRSMSASFLIMVAYVAFKLIDTTALQTQSPVAYASLVKAFDVYGLGMLWFGTFVYFIGLLIISTEPYTTYGSKKQDTRSRYWRCQALALLSGFGAMYFGTMYNIPQLQGISGTVMVIYFLTKLWEVGWKNRYRSLTALAISLLGLLAVYYAQQNPTFFIPVIKG